MRFDLAAAGLACALWLGGTAGCGIFKSSTSQASSESSSDSSTSSSKSSSGDDEKKEGAYERDVRDATARNAAGGTLEVRSFEKQVSAIAAGHGITDWEGDPYTYRGIGSGLARAGVQGAELDRLASELSHEKPRYREWIRSGYDTARP